MSNLVALSDVINVIFCNRDSGRLEMTLAGTHGAFFFSEGKLLDARLGSLIGFQAVNTALAIRNAQFTFDNSTSMPTSSSITPNDRIVLKRFFGIECVGVEELSKELSSGTQVSGEDLEIAEVDWDMTPKQVVPLSEVQEFGEDSSQFPAIEAGGEVHLLTEEPARFSQPEQSHIETDEVGESIAPYQQSVSDIAPNLGTTKPQAQSFARPRIGLYVALGLALVAAAIGLRLKLNERHQPTPGTDTMESASLEVPEPQREERQSEPLLVSGSQSKVGTGSPSVAGPKGQSSLVSNQPSLSPEQSPPTKLHDASARNLTGEWKVVNTVEKTAYRPFSNLKIGFRIVINQTGDGFTAKGEKVSENGRNLPASNRTRIHVNGSIQGDKIVATFREEGATRQTIGRFVWRIQKAGAGLTGTFVSTAARSSGKSAATRQL